MTYLTSALTGMKCIANQLRSLTPPLTRIKGRVKVKITFTNFFLKDQMYRQSHDKFGAYSTRVKVRRRFEERVCIVQNNLHIAETQTK